MPFTAGADLIFKGMGNDFEQILSGTVQIVDLVGDAIELSGGV
jgi:hypothetical protein